MKGGDLIAVDTPSPCFIFSLSVHAFTEGAGRSTEVERSLMVRCVVGSILHGVDPLSYFSFQPVLHDWCNKCRGMCAYKRVSFFTIRMVLNHMSDAI